MASNAASLVNQFAFSVALEKITWKTYFIYLGICSLEAVYYCFLIPADTSQGNSGFHLGQSAAPRVCPPVCSKQRLPPVVNRDFHLW